MRSAKTSPPFFASFRTIVVFGIVVFGIDKHSSHADAQAMFGLFMESAPIEAKSGWD